MNPMHMREEALFAAWNLAVAAHVAGKAFVQAERTAGLPFVIGGRVFVGRTRAEAVAKAHRHRARGCTVVGPRLAPWQWKNLRGRRLASP